MAGHLLVPADASLGEGDDAVGARFGHEPSAIEERFDPLAGVVRCRSELDLQQPPSVEATSQECRLLEHADEDTRVAFGDEGSEVVRVHEPVSVPKRAVDRAELVG